MKTNKTFLISSILFTLILLAMILISARVYGQSTREIFSIPKLNKIKIDGKSDDWGDRGFKIEILSGTEGQILPFNDFDAKVQVGWNKRGLLVLWEVQDDIPDEGNEKWMLRKKDCVEVHLAEYQGSANHYDLAVAPAADPQFVSPRSHFSQHWGGKYQTPLLDNKIECSVFDGGYIVEMLMPWQNLHLQPVLDMEFVLQFIAKDFDGKDDLQGLMQVCWFPSLLSSYDSNYMHRVKLSKSASEPIKISARREVDEKGYRINVIGTEDLVGNEVDLSSTSGVVDSQNLELKGNRVNASFDIVLPENEVGWQAMDVKLYEKSVASFDEVFSVKNILDKYAHVCGISVNDVECKTRVFSGRLIHDLSYRDPAKEIIQFESAIQYPDKWKIFENASDGIHRLGCDGTLQWAERPEGNEIKKREYIPDIFWATHPEAISNLSAYFNRIIYKGENVGMDRRSAHYNYSIEAIREDGSSLYFHFDKDSGFLDRVGHINCCDYKEVDGVNLPTRLWTGRKGGSSTYYLDKIQNNANISEDAFVIPMQ
jgi:Carbohydrate family 9 binding domain-like